MHAPGCPLCDGPGGHVVASCARFRVVRAQEAGFPAFYRVIWNEHVAEFTDLDAADRALCMNAVAHVETLMRRLVRPDKVNLAALGNMVPHLHWHVVARFEWDSHFPSAIWSSAVRPLDAARLAQVESRLPELEQAMADSIR